MGQGSPSMRRRALREFPDAEGLGGVRGLGVAAKLSVGGVAVDYFGELAETPFAEESGHAAEVSPGGGDGLR
jgi:hypothetical protein